MSIDGNWIRKNETKEFSEVQMDYQPQIDIERNIKLEMFNGLIERGIDRVAAYQIAYNLSYEDAKDLAARDSYNNLIACGVPIEAAREIAYKNEESSSKTR